MKSTQVNIAPIACELSHLSVFTTDPNTESQNTILREDEAFQVRVTIEFGDSGAIALMPLCLLIEVNFFAEPYGLGPKVELGNALVNTAAGIFSYSPTLAKVTPAEIGLSCPGFYQVTAFLRVGAANFPALIIGLIEGLTIQIYHPS
ncbi:MAG: hypothetical protein U7123_03075 [Potamolinea sp.]